jgi:hypothetical protein
MARQRSKKISEGRKALQQLTAPAQDQRDEEVSDNESLDIMDKDEDELELDRLVLGDRAGFMAQIDQGVTEDGERDSEEADLEADVGLGDAEENLEGVDDADVGYPYEYLKCLHTDDFCSFFFSIVHHLPSMETFWFINRV